MTPDDGCADHIVPGYEPNEQALACAVDLADDRGQAVLETADGRIETSSRGLMQQQMGNDT